MNDSFFEYDLKASIWTLFGLLIGICFRLRLLDKELYLIEYLKVPVQVIPHLTEEILLSSFYNDIKKNFKLKIVGANRKIRADLPNNLEVEYLKCTPTTPMLEVQQVTYLNNGLLLNMFVHVIRMVKGLSLFIVFIMLIK